MTIVFSVLVLEIDAPALSILFSEEEVAAFNAQLLSIFASMAILLNGLIIVVATMVLLSVKKMQKAGRSAFIQWVVLPLGSVQFFGFLSDVPLGNANIILNGISMLILVIGFLLSLPKR